MIDRQHNAKIEHNQDHNSPKEDPSFATHVVSSQRVLNAIVHHLHCLPVYTNGFHVDTTVPKAPQKMIPTHSLLNEELVLFRSLTEQDQFKASNSRRSVHLVYWPDVK